MHTSTSQATTAAWSAPPADTAAPDNRATARWEALAPHRQRMVRLARRLGAGNDAEDIAQEALLRTARIPRLELDRAHSYLAKVTANLVTDAHRRAARDRALQHHAALAACPERVDEDVIDRDLARHAAQLVSRLAPPVREILRLRQAGATWPQVGARLGQSPASTEMRYRRAMTDLRQRLRA